MRKIIIMLLITTGVVGCSSNTIEQHYIQVGKNSAIAITDMRSQLKNNLLVAQTTILNKGNKQINGFYRCQFFNTNGMTLGDPQQWQSITIYPNESQSVKCLATDTEATNFKVEFSVDGKNVAVAKTA